MSDYCSSSIVRACAIIGSAVVPYRRVGRGQVVLLLGGVTTAALTGVPSDLCVIAPEGVPHDSTFNPWVGLFLDTLGFQDVWIVAIGNFAPRAREFAALEPDRVRRVLSIRAVEGSLAVANALRTIADFS